MNDELDRLYGSYATLKTREERDLVSQKLADWPEIANRLAASVGKTLAPTDVATLLQFANSAGEKQLTPQLAKVQAQLLGQCLDIPRDRLAAASIARTRRSVHEASVKFGPTVYLDLLKEPTIASLSLVALLADSRQATAFSDSVHNAAGDWAQAFSKCVLGLKTAPPRRILCSFSGVLTWLPQEVWDETLVPAFKKALLRASEMTLQVLPVVISFLPPLNFDKASEAFKSSLVSNIGSSNAAVRAGSAETMGLLLDRSQVLAETVTPAFTKATGEARVLYAQVFLHVATSEAALKAIDTVAAKETSEQTLKAIVKAAVHLNATETIVRGMADKRAPLRREWVCAGAELFEDKQDESIKSALQTALDDVLGNPTSAIANKLIAAGYAAASALKAQAALILLTDSKIYERLSSSEELYWAQRTVCALSCPEITDCAVVLSQKAPRELVKESRQMLDQIYATGGVPQALALSCERSRYTKLSVFGTSSDDAAAALVNLLIVAHLDNQSWTALCLKAKQDPGKLVLAHYEQMLERIWTAPSDLIPAANRALATIAFVNPDCVAPKIVAYIKEHLVPVSLSADDVLVFQTPAGQVALTSEIKKKQGQNAQSWDDQIRAELAKKNAKLSPEDRKLLEQQDQVRTRVGEILARYSRAISAIDALSLSPAETGINQWFPVAVEHLIAVSRLELATEARECLLALSRNVTGRFGDVLPKVGQALLWRLKLGQEGSGERLSEVLYRAKFLADQQPLDRVSLIYLLPILVAIIKQPATSDEQEEQLLLTLNIIATEADELDLVPRGDLVVSLIALLERDREKAKDVKDCLQRVAQGVLFDEDEQNTLLASTVSPNPYVRTATLEIIDAEVDLRALNSSPEVFIECFGENAPLAHTIYKENSLKAPAVAQLIPFLGLASVAKAIEYVVAQDVGILNESVDLLCSHYKQLREPPKRQLDEFGMEIKQRYEDPWQKRQGALEALTLLTSFLDKSLTLDVAKFVASSAVSDPSPVAYNQAHKLGLSLVEVQGAQYLDDLLALFEDFVKEKNPDEQVRQAHVLLYGMEARHLGQDDRLEGILGQLLDALNTPSEKVQISIAECVVPLAKRVDCGALFAKLLERVSQGENAKGASFGISGLVKGIGISALSDFGVTRAVFEGAEDVKNPTKRQGAQVLIGCLSTMLGKLFEPYALELLPIVLGGLGDGQAPVRASATEAARNVMKHTTGYGIKLQIPMTLSRLSDNAWRTKKGAVELLGSMAYLDPQQLSASLSTIVPEIVGVLGDTHKEVRAAGKSSLHSFGEVIKNPEIKELVPVLLEAISDPTKNTDAALDALLKTKFVHYIDTPSLALVIHVLKRGLNSRSASTKRKSCQVVGNMSILTEASDLVPYLDEIMPDLQVAMVDPVPATCSTACKALGVLVEKLGEDTFPQVIPNMLETLRDPSKISDRWGVAQGLAEVIHGLGVHKLDEMLPTILAGCQSVKGHVRQAFIPLLLFLPSSFGQAITPYLSALTPAILHGLADSLDDVRENALKAGRRVVRNFASKAVDLLLPELEAGLSDPNWRIRLSSVELTGDLLFQLSGVSKNTSEDAAVSTKVQTVLTEVLGAQRKSRILSLIFICRADVVGAVRQSALEVWMTLVANTPRTVKEILETLSHIIVRKLSDADEELQRIAARALGELVRRVNGALTQLLPLFENMRGDPSAREGICIGLIELIQSTPFDVLKENEAGVTKLIRSCLTDLDDSVREAASQAFDALQEALGEVAQDILPELIAQMETGDEGAFAALKEMMSTSPEVVFPALLPKLIAEPMTPFKASSLADICEVAGEALYKRLDSVVDALLVDDEEISSQLTRVLLVHAPQTHLLHVLKNDHQKGQLILRQLATVFVEDHSQVDMVFMSDFVAHAIVGLEREPAASHEFLISLSSSLGKSQLAELVDAAYKALLMTSAPVEGFALPKGPQCVLPIFLNALTLGSNKQKESAALAIAAVVERAEPEHLKASVTAMTGPLIRVVGEKYPADVKSAIVYTLSVLLQRIGAFLRPFMPQLQRSFVKCLSDTSSAILRERAAKALSTLIGLQPRLEPLTKEILTAVESAEPAVQKSMLRVLYDIALKAESLSDATHEQILDLVQVLSGTSDIRVLSTLASIAALVAKDLSRFQRESLFGLLVVNAALIHSPEHAVDSLDFLCTSSQSHSPEVSEAGVQGLAKYALKYQNPQAVDALVKCVAKDESRSPDTRRLALFALSAVVKANHSLVEAHLDELVVPLFASVRDTTIPVKLAAENTFLDVFKFIETGNAAFFDTWFVGACERGAVPEQYQRSLSEYVRRVAMRHTVSRREQLEAGVEQTDDLAELMSVGPLEAESI